MLNKIAIYEERLTHMRFIGCQYIHIKLLFGADLGPAASLARTPSKTTLVGPSS